MLKKVADKLDYCKQLFGQEDASGLMEVFLITAFTTLAIVSGLAILSL